MKKIILALSVLALGAFVTPAMAEKGGTPNENASENAGGSANAQGGNPNAGKGHDNGSPGHGEPDGTGNGQGNGHGGGE